MSNTDYEESPRNGIFKKPSRIPAKYGNAVNPATPRSETRKCKDPINETQLSIREKKKLQDAHTKLNDLNKSVLQLEGKLNNYTGRQKSAEQLVGDLISPHQMQQLDISLRKHYASGVLMCEKFLKLNQQLSDGHILVNNHISKPNQIFRFILRFLRFKVPAWRKKLCAALSEMLKILEEMKSNQNNYVCQFFTQVEQLKICDLDEYGARQHSAIVENLTKELKSLTSQLATLNEKEISITASTDDDKKKDKVIAELNDHFQRLSGEIFGLVSISDHSCRNNETAELREKLKLAQEQLQSYSFDIKQLQEQSEKLEFLHTEKTSELLDSLDHEKSQRHMLQLELDKFKEQINEMQNFGDHSEAGSIFNETLQMQATIEKLCNEKNYLKEEVYRLQIADSSQNALHTRLMAQLQEKDILLDCENDKIRNLEQQHVALQEKIAEVELCHSNEIDILNTAASKSDLILQELNAEMIVMQQRLHEQSKTAKVHQQLLSVRTNLIADIQSDQDLLRHQLSVQSFEISAREEELQNIISTLAAKDVELAQQKELISQLKIDRENDKVIASDLQAKMIQKSTENALLKRHFHEIMHSHKMF